MIDNALIFVKGIFEEAHWNIYALDWVEQKTRRIMEMDKWHRIQWLVSFKFSRKGFILVIQKVYITSGCDTHPFTLKHTLEQPIFLLPC